MRKAFQYIIIVEILILLVLVLFNAGIRRKEAGETGVEQEEELPSILTILPYESTGFSIYYYVNSDTYSVIIHEDPVERNIRDALFIMHQYEETKDFTEEDIRIVTPSYMNLQ